LRFYRRFLDEATRVPNREMVEQHISDLEKALAAAPPEPPPPANSGGTTTVVPATAMDLTAPASPPSEPRLVGTPATASAEASSSDVSVLDRWWFWPAVGVVVIGAGVGTYLVLRGGSDCPSDRVCM
jgi:hypothetical protein